MLRMAVAAAAICGPALAQGSDPNAAFPPTGGEGIYRGVCQGCHMPDGQGAEGAGAYPALTGKRLQSAAYPAEVVIRGRKAMPPFGPYLSDQQIADVVNYVRTHFGNAYADKATPELVRSLRPPATAGGGE